MSPMGGHRVVVVGGTFDPVHRGHLALISGAARLLRADLGILVAEEGHRHRAAAVASVEERRRLVRLAVSTERRLAEAASAGYTGGLCSVVAALVAERRDVHVVFGSDSARHLDRWEGRRRLAGATLWSVPRSGDEPGPIDGVQSLHLHLPAWSATQVRHAVAAGSGVPRSVPMPCRSTVQRLYAPAPMADGELLHA